MLATGIVERVLSWARFKAQTELQKAGGGKKAHGGRLLDLPKLDDANWAGGARGADATLILTEGDSAKSLAIAGLSTLGRDAYGVFPLKGKLLNVRDASHRAIMANAEIQAVVRILGLQYGKTYADAKGLRYGHLMIMSDQDHDGSHIKGLLINFLHVRSSRGGARGRRTRASADGRRGAARARSLTPPPRPSCRSTFGRRCSRCAAFCASSSRRS